MNRNIIFTTSVYDTYTTSFSTSILVDYALKCETQNNGITRTNKGGFHSTTWKKDTMPDIFIPLFVELDNLVGEWANYNNIPDLCLQNFWININRKYHYNNEHRHPNSILSGCVYLKVPTNSGNINFYRDDPLADYWSNIDANQPEQASMCSMIPKENKVFLFPSYVTHSVDQNLTTDEDDARISIAFNYKRKHNE